MSFSLITPFLQSQSWRNFKTLSFISKALLLYSSPLWHDGCSIFSLKLNLESEKLFFCCQLVLWVIGTYMQEINIFLKFLKIFHTYVAFHLFLWKIYANGDKGKISVDFFLKFSLLLPLLFIAYFFTFTDVAALVLSKRWYLLDYLWKIATLSFTISSCNWKVYGAFLSSSCR